MEKAHFGWAVVAGAGVVGVALLEFVFADLIVEAKFPAATARILEQLPRALFDRGVGNKITQDMARCVAQFSGCNKEAITGTVHLLVTTYVDNDIEGRLLQISDYTGRLGGKKGRLIDPAKGIVGRSLRLGRPDWVSFRDQTEYLERMVDKFGFTQDEARRHTTSARSYLAVPIGENDGPPDLVLFFFSTEPQVFPLCADIDEVKSVGITIRNYLEVSGVISQG